MPGRVKDERAAMLGDREHIKLMSLIGGYLHSELERASRRLHSLRHVARWHAVSPSADAAMPCSV